jgi:hypothetical protein
LRRQRSARLQGKGRIASRWRSNKRHRFEPLLLLIADCVRRHYVLRIHLSHDELAQHLDLLYLRHGQFIAHLHGLQVAHRGLVLQLEVSQGSLFEPEILRLSLSRGKSPSVFKVISPLAKGLWTPAIEVTAKPP